MTIKRLLDTISDDKAMATSIKDGSVTESIFLGGMAISVYCFYGNVFLVGEIPRLEENTGHCKIFLSRGRLRPLVFAPAKARQEQSGFGNGFAGSPDWSKGFVFNQRIDTEVNAGRVVLLGVVKDNAEKQQAIRIARKVPSCFGNRYLILPKTVANGKTATD